MMESKIVYLGSDHGDEPRLAAQPKPWAVPQCKPLPAVKVSFPLTLLQFSG